MDLFIAICNVIFDLLMIAFGLWGLSLIFPIVRCFIIGMSLMFVWGVILLVLCFNFGAIGYSVSVLTPILFLIIYNLWNKEVKE